MPRHTLLNLIALCGLAMVTTATTPVKAAEEPTTPVILTSNIVGANAPTIEYGQAGVMKRARLAEGRWQAEVRSNFSLDGERLFRLNLIVDPSVQISLGLRIQARKAPLEMDISTKLMSCNRDSLKVINTMFTGASDSREKTRAILNLLRLERACISTSNRALRPFIAASLIKAYCAYAEEAADLIVLGTHRSYISTEFGTGLGQLDQCAKKAKYNYASAAWREANDVILAAPTDERASYQRAFALDFADIEGWKSVFSDIAKNSPEYRAFRANVDYSLGVAAIDPNTQADLLTATDRSKVIANYVGVTDLAKSAELPSGEDAIVFRRSQLDTNSVLDVSKRLEQVHNVEMRGD